MMRKLTVCGFGTLACLSLTMAPALVQGASLDKAGEIKLGVRAYVNARVGVEQTDKIVETAQESQTFPLSEAGHLRQNRFYVEAEFHQELARLQKEGWGPLDLLNQLPFRVRNLAYHLTFRGEYDGIYDWGPREYSTANQYVTPGPGVLPGEVTLTDNPINLQPSQMPGGVCPISPTKDFGICGLRVNVPGARERLRSVASNRQRLFQAYVEANIGNSLYLRFGRQVWSWGETDGFRLLDQINPIDSSFGGFLISLDERRLPLDMLRTEYRIGTLGPFSEVALQGYGAIDNKVGFAPGTPAGSPWTLPNLGKPSATTETIRDTPARTIRAMRGGGRLAFNALDATFSLAHYYTYFDTPGLQVFVQPGVQGFPTKTFDNGFSAQAVQTAPKVQVSGGSTTFAVPSLYTIVRSELAYFHREPRFRQQEIDPFLFHFAPGSGAPGTGGRRLGDSFNYCLGFDINQYIRPLNPNQTFFISTQVFYKHLFNAQGRSKATGRPVYNGEVLPVPQFNMNVAGLGRVEPSFIRQGTDQILQTLFIGTSYMSGQVNPGFLFFYDWSGSMVYQPSVTLIHDPWRFTVNYSILDAGTLKGNSGVSLLRDRDNILFQFEYAI